MPHLRRPTPGMMALCIIIILAAFRLTGSTQVQNASGTNERRTVTVQTVLDGDTFVTTTGERVRLLGIDAPEVAHHDTVLEPFGTESTEWLTERILNTDVQLHIGIEGADRYGRTLAWVYTADGAFINQEALSGGYAELLDRFGLPLQLEASLRQAAAEAQVAGRGLWGRKQ